MTVPDTFSHLETADDEVDRSVGGLECITRVAPFRWWRWRSLLAIVVVVVVVVMATSIIMPIISVVTALVITAITLAVVTHVIAVVATIVFALIIVAVVAMITTSILVVIATIGPAVTVITSIRSTVTVVEALVTVPVVVVAALGLLGLGGYSEGTLQLLALPHGVFGVAVKLSLVVHDHVEVAFEEGGRSWWVRHVGFARSLARPISSAVMISTVEVVHHRVLSVD
jgi:hypothetical protein